jgi:CheY-like chemotaxis protein
MTSESPPILIIEDEDVIRETFQLFLELEGYVVLTAGNGREGLEQLRKMTRPCLILLDLMMPVMNGEEFLKAKTTEESMSSIPVCVVSGAANIPDLPGVAACVPKPVSAESLLDLVRRYCGSSNRAHRPPRSKE